MAKLADLWHRIALYSAALLLLLVTCVAIATRYDALTKLTGFNALMALALIALVVVAVGAIGLGLATLRWRKRKANARIVVASFVAFAVGAAYYGFVEQWMAPVGELPLLHDITTDLNKPPVFRKLTLRADNLKGVTTTDEWRVQHRKGYPDIQSAQSTLPAAKLFENALALAQSKKWEIVLVDPNAGVIEAVDHVAFLRFVDMIAIRVTPLQGSTGSVIDMRSVSDVGTSDLGVNAKRIREFLRALQK
jgi:Protein of unknown function (DUF1499)